MSKYEKQFYKCLGYQTKIKYKKPLFFYHIPKCAGTTISVLISHLFNKSHRILGPLFNNNDKGGVIAYEKYLNDKKLINSSNLNFIYGHVPFEIHKTLKKKYIYAAAIRNPIERCLSHYIWGLNRGYYSLDDGIENLFKTNKIPQNAIVNQFSGVGLSKPDCEKSIELSYKNLSDKIDILFDINNIFEFLNLIISLYDLPNLFFQNQQVNFNKIKIPTKTLNVIKKYNEKDILLYSKIFEKKITYDFESLKKINREKNFYLYSSPNILIRNKKTLILNKNEIIEIEKKLLKSKFKIISNWSLSVMFDFTRNYTHTQTCEFICLLYLIDRKEKDWELLKGRAVE